MPAPQLSDKELRATLEAVRRAGGNRVHAAQQLGIPHATLQHRLGIARNRGIAIPASPYGHRVDAKKVEPPPPIEEVLLSERLRAQIANMQRERREIMSRLEQAERRADAALEISGIRSTLTIAPKSRSHRRQAAACALWSDFHLEEEVLPEKVNGLNFYNLAEAKRRAERFFEGVVWKTKHHQANYDIATLLLWILGDMITGYIHEELVETNGLSPVQAVDRFVDIAAAGIKYILAELPDTKLIVPMVPGNHGRTTARMRVKTRIENSFEWMGYRQIARLFEGEDRVQPIIAAGSHLYVRVWDWDLRGCHGDDIDYQGGIGGVIVPLKKKLLQWNRARHADYTFVGHFHDLQDFNIAVVNGSVIGMTEYSVAKGFEFRHPQQAFLLIDKTRGKDYVSPIFMNDSGRRGERRAA